MEFPEPNFSLTPYGEVDTKRLAWLRETYDTATLLQFVDQLDALKPRLAANGGIRDDLLQLHRMAHTVINDANLAEPQNEMTLWEVANELADELYNISDVFSQAAQRLRPLVALRPDQGD
ncbi:Tn3 family transposase post-transcriptional regulator TnpC [Chitinimonas naiadis]